MEPISNDPFFEGPLPGGWDADPIEKEQQPVSDPVKRRRGTRISLTAKEAITIDGEVRARSLKIKAPLVEINGTVKAWRKLSIQADQLKIGPNAVIARPWHHKVKAEQVELPSENAWLLDK